MDIERKSTLAKLLATENVSLEHKNVPTAYFDLKDRKVVLPILKSDISPEMYDLFIGHEVSHALNTPLEGWHDSIETKGRGFKSFLNVVEDARIERDIKNRFPGLTKSFFNGYRELYQMDFFGLGENDINDYPLIDRINLFFKVGMFANIEFTDEEQKFVDLVSSTESWDDVVKVAEKLYAYAETEDVDQELPDAFHGDPEQGDYDEPVESESPDSQPSEEDQNEEHDSDDSAESEQQQDSGEKLETSDDEEGEEKDSTSILDNEYSDEPVSVTDQNFRDNEEKLIDHKNEGDIHWVDFPKNLDYTKFVNMNALDGVDEAIRNDNEFYVSGRHSSRWYDDGDTISFDEAGSMLVNNFNKKNRPFLNLMVSQFEAKRKANQLAKSREHKTGDLNMNKLWATKLTEDVFLSSTVTPDGKNHGMLMVVDFSGSMYEKVQATIEQMLLQVAFCRKVNIPYEVYSFTTGHNKDPDIGSKLDNQKDGDVQLVESDLLINRLLHSGMSSSAHKNAHKTMLMIGSSYSNYKTRMSGLPYCDQYAIPKHLCLGSTPLDSMVLLLRDIAIDFRNNNRVDVLNTLFLTDGGNTGHIGLGNQHAVTRSYGYGKDRVAIRENGITTISDKGADRIYYPRFNDVVCRTLIKHYDRTTGSRTVNYFLSDATRSQIKEKYKNIYGWQSEGEFDKKWKSEWLPDGYIQVDGLDGFPTAFVLRSRDLGEESELEVNSDKKGDLVRGFRKFQKTKSTSRKFLGKFIEKIA